MVLKKDLAWAPVMQFPIWNQLFYIKMDLSVLLLGSAITHEWEVKVRLSVEYASRNLYSP